MNQLDFVYKLSNSGNNEILFTWLKLCLQAEYAPAYPYVERFLINVGRRKFVAPLFKIMADNPSLKPMGERIYKRSRSNYHSVTYETVDKMFGYGQEAEPVASDSTQAANAQSSADSIR